jgi:hypothetical protein
MSALVFRERKDVSFRPCLIPENRDRKKAEDLLGM